MRSLYTETYPGRKQTTYPEKLRVISICGSVSLAEEDCSWNFRHCNSGVVHELSNLIKIRSGSGHKSRTELYDSERFFLSERNGCSCWVHLPRL
uniref:Uncharacterized protein n=1 Tax=Romanomermis culicivorax TaxID=13658 RepID=A0A915IB99_ROMCU